MCSVLCDTDADPSIESGSIYDYSPPHHKFEHRIRVVVPLGAIVDNQSNEIADCCGCGHDCGRSAYLPVTHFLL